MPSYKSPVPAAVESDSNSPAGPIQHFNAVDSSIATVSSHAKTAEMNIRSQPAHESDPLAYSNVTSATTNNESINSDPVSTLGKLQHNEKESANDPHSVSITSSEIKGNKADDNTVIVKATNTDLVEELKKVIEVKDRKIKQMKQKIEQDAQMLAQMVNETQNALTASFELSNENNIIKKQLEYETSNYQSRNNKIINELLQQEKEKNLQLRRVVDACNDKIKTLMDSITKLEICWGSSEEVIREKNKELIFAGDQITILKSQSSVLQLEKEDLTKKLIGLTKICHSLHEKLTIQKRKVQIFCRIKKPMDSEVGDNLAVNNIRISHEDKYVVDVNSTFYRFDKVYSPAADNEELFHEVIQAFTITVPVPYVQALFNVATDWVLYYAIYSAYVTNL